MILLVVSKKNKFAFRASKHYELAMLSKYRTMQQEYNGVLNYVMFCKSLSHAPK